ncbi:MAG: gamma-glutamyl-gamma-aminobutyrate hydrolase family protein [Microthrixaceae bacterium]
MSLPRIGLSSCFDHADPKRALFTDKTLLYVEQSMIEWVAAGGAIVYPIPTAPAGGPPIQGWVDDLDALVLHGGADVAPTSYGAASPDARWPGDPVRDAYELDLYRRFRRAGKPVLGICRGMQVMNVAHGGTLFQDLIVGGATTREHRDAEAYERHLHEVSVTEGSQLAQLVGGAGPWTVNSIHHQGVDRLGDDLEVEAHSVGDEVVEALRVTSGPWAAGVQWHPEFFGHLDPQVHHDQPLIDNSALRTAFIDEVHAHSRLGAGS